MTLSQSPTSPSVNEVSQEPTAGHTSGRWYAQGPTVDADDYPNRDYWQIRYEHGPRGYGAEIARITSYNTGHEEANSRLLAAAPDLLDAAKLGLSIAKSWIEQEMTGAAHTEAMRALEPIRAAIARASGEKT